VPESHTEHALLSADFDRALLLATRHHRCHLRKGSETPYVAHLLAVAALVLEMGGSESEAIGALLHNAVEDGGGPEMLANIRRDFGDDVARIVKANSDTDQEPKPPWPERKRAYIASMATKAPDELRVSLADKLHNARAIVLDYRSVGDELWKRFKPGEGESLRRYYRSLYDAFCARAADMGPAAQPLLDELGRTLDELDRLAG
jgi:(p)ppGpp synthase/HD superfamily hydrolase